MQWHGVEVVKLPDNSTLLASSPHCRVQAMRVGDRAWSMQYHVEVEPDTVDNWGAIPAYRDALEKTLGAEAMRTLRTDAAREMGGFIKNAKALYTNFRKASGL
ncbi:MAG: hypothetical protein ACR2RE_18855 [Geminicoccaceae bacterium]